MLNFHAGEGVVSLIIGFSSLQGLGAISSRFEYWCHRRLIGADSYLQKWNHLIILIVVLSNSSLDHHLTVAYPKILTIMLNKNFYTVDKLVLGCLLKLQESCAYLRLLGVLIACLIFLLGVVAFFLRPLLPLLWGCQDPEIMITACLRSSPPPTWGCCYHLSKVNSAYLLCCMKLPEEKPIASCLRRRLTWIPQRGSPITEKPALKI